MIPVLGITYICNVVSDYWDLFGLNYKGSLGPPLFNTKGPKAVPDCLEYYLFDLSNRLVVKGPSSKFSKFLCKGKDDSYGNGSSKKLLSTNSLVG